MTYPQTLLGIIRARSLAEKTRLLDKIQPPAEAADWSIPLIPERPGRPEHFQETDTMPRRRRGLQHDGTRHRFLLAIHHIEMTAIDLAVLLCLRSPGMDSAYHRDFLQVAREECQHTALLEELLNERGYPPGSQPVHFRLWDSACAACDAGEQMVVIPRFLEARGLDVTAELLPRMHSIDEPAWVVLKRIYDDEIGHVERGSYWHRQWCRQQGLDATEHFSSVVRKYFADQIPSAQGLDYAGRRQAGFVEAELDLLDRRKA